MNRVSTAAVSDFNHAVKSKIGLVCWRGSHAIGLACFKDMQRISVRVREHSDSGNTHLASCPLNSQGDLAAVSNQDFADLLHGEGGFYRNNDSNTEASLRRLLRKAIVLDTGLLVVHDDAARRLFILLFFICLAGAH